MRKPLVVIVGGFPCTGKTTFSRRIAADLSLPLLAKDDIKEILFDTLGVGDRNWSRNLGFATFRLLYQMLREQLRVGHSVIVEGNFRALDSAEEFLAIRRRYDFEPFQITFRTEPGVLFERFQARAHSGERHHGHLDDVVWKEIKAGFRPEQFDAMPLGGTAVVVDTTDWQRAEENYPSLLARIQAALARSKK